MRILLTTINSKYIHVNLAIRLLYELNKHHKGLAWKEFASKEKKELIAHECADFDVVAFSCYIWNITATLEVARMIKGINPNIKILLGGPEVSYDYDEIIRLPEVDFIILGEGEIPFTAFMDSYPNISLVPNLVYVENNKCVLTPSSKTFDLIGFKDIMPYINDDPKDLHNKVCYIETSRGCPYHCEFCLASLDNKVRYLPMDHIKNTLLYLMNHAKVIKFLDRTFNVKKDFTLEMFQFILDHHQPGNIFQFEITADIVHPDIIAFILEKVPRGLFRFEIGIQTVNQKANLEVSRKQNFEKTKGVILQLAPKIEMHLDLIVGLPLDYFDDIKYSFEQVFALHPPELQLGFLKFLKGTPVREKYAQYGFVFDPNPPYEIIQSNYLNKEELNEIRILEEALEIYWNKKRAYHTLCYVSTEFSVFDFLLGLGKLFHQKSNFHQHSLEDTFEILYEFVQSNYPENIALQELVAIDYYLHFKVRPKELFLTDISKEDKHALIKKMGLNIHQNRYLGFDIHFDWNVFLETNKLANGAHSILIEYTGTEKATALSL